MKKKSKLFDKRFVHFMWDDELIGKKCFFADGIDDLRGIVEKGGECDMRIVLSSSGNESEPFQAAHGLYAWKFAYYDPNYEVKKAFSEGKTVQVKRIDSFADWVDCDEPIWSKECCYRVKPECPCDAGIDSKACVGCEHSEDGKPHPFENYHCYGCDKSSKKGYRPYETVHEFIQDYQDRFPTTNPRPCYTLPFIWLRNKNKKDERELVYCFRNLVINMDNTYWDMNDLFNQWEYLDGSPCGMEVKE